MGTGMTTSLEQEGCKGLYVGGLHPYVNEACLQDLFASVGAVADVKLVKDKATGQSAGSAFITYETHQAAALALQLSGHVIYGKELRVSWAFQKDKAEDTATHFHIFVGNLSGNVTDPALLEAFKAAGSCSDARVMWDHATGRSKGYGFVSFRTQEDAERAIQTMNGMVVGQWRVRCGWANHKQETVGDMDAASVDKADPTNANVYVGNLSAEVDDAELKRQFARFGPVAGVKACLKGGYGFVQFCDHAAAVAAIVEMNGRQLGGKTLKCAWGRHQNRAAPPPPPPPPPPLLPPLPLNPIAAQGLLRLGMLGAPAPPVLNPSLGPRAGSGLAPPPGAGALQAARQAPAALAPLCGQLPSGPQDIRAAYPSPPAYSAAPASLYGAGGIAQGADAYSAALQQSLGAGGAGPSLYGGGPGDAGVLGFGVSTGFLGQAGSASPDGLAGGAAGLGLYPTLAEGGPALALGLAAGGFRGALATAGASSFVLGGSGLGGGAAGGGAPLPGAQHYALAAAYGSQAGGAGGLGGPRAPSAGAVSEAQFTELYYSQYYNL